MAWFGEGLSSLKGQLSNLAKNVLVDDEDTPLTEGANESPLSFHVSNHPTVVSDPGEHDTFVGQDHDGSYTVGGEEGSQLNQNEDGGSLRKGLSSLFQQIGEASQHLSRASTRRDVETQTSHPHQHHNADLESEVDTLRRTVRELESQIASSQDVNANLSTGLEELDIQHQEAIERIVELKDDALKELEQLRGELARREEAYSALQQENTSLLKQVEMLSVENLGNETLTQENNELRVKLSELLKGELPAIPEQSAAEEHVRSLEAEATALRESRDNLERETASLIGQLRQRDLTLRQVDAKLEDVTKEKEIKEREMTQIVFECNSLREELKTATDNKGVLEKEGVEYRNEIEFLKERLEEVLRECELSKSNLESTKREASLVRDESETLKAELASLKEDLGGGEAKSLLDMKQLEEARQGQKLASQRIEALSRRVSDLEGALAMSRGEAEAGREALDSELNTLRDIAREYGIQKDVFREKEGELKRQLTQANAQIERLNISSLRQTQHPEKEIEKYKNIINDLTLEKEKLLEDLLEVNTKVVKAERELERKENELSSTKSTLLLIQKDVDGYQNVIRLLEVKIGNYEEQIQILTDSANQNKTVCENLNNLLEEKEQQVLKIENLSKEIQDLKNENSQLVSKMEEMFHKKKKYEEALESLSCEKEGVESEKVELKKVSENLASELILLRGECESLRGELSSARERLAGEEEAAGQARLQVDHLKDELKELYEEKEELVTQSSGDKSQLLQELQVLRGELATITTLKQEAALTKQTLEEKNKEVSSLQSECKRLSTALSVQLGNNETLYKEKNDLLQKNEEILVQTQRKMSNMEETELMKNKEVEMLKQEVENLKTQLEYASQLLQDVERQEGEGQPSGEQASQKVSPELQEELNRLSAALLKEQTDKKILTNQMADKVDRLEKAETQLRRLKSHLVEVQDSYSSELSTAEEKLREMQSQLVGAEERARTSTTAYTSASIRSNQQVEALREQLRLLTEHRDRMEQEVSQAEDAAAKQSAAVTRLQAVLHHFQIDKQKDIEFETERIRRDLSLSEKRNSDLMTDKKNLQEKLDEARRGLAAVQNLNDQLLRQSETITQLKTEIFELNEKLRTKEEKVNDLNSEKKVDKDLVTNLLVGYVASPVESKAKILGVLAQVLGLTKEDRQKIGLEPGGRMQSLSEAFIKFLQSESQPRAEVILPLATTTPLPPSRKSSLLSPEVPNLPHFPIGRNPGSILKDVLQERRPE